MLVIYNKVNVLRLAKMDPREGKIRGLMPGVNDIDDAEWAKCVKTYPMLTRYLEEGVIEIPETSDGKPVEANELGTLNERQAIKLVKETASEDLLLKWHDSESASKRKGVVKAIEAQMDRLAKAGEPLKKKDGDDAAAGDA